jgi:hypothetical protein
MVNFAELAAQKRSRRHEVEVFLVLVLIGMKGHELPGLSSEELTLHFSATASWIAA